MLANHPVRVFCVVKIMNLLSSPLSFVNTYCFFNYKSKLMCIFMVRVTINFAQMVQKKWEPLSRRAEDSTLEAWPSEEKASCLPEGLLTCQVMILPGSVQVTMLWLNAWKKGRKENVENLIKTNKQTSKQTSIGKAQGQSTLLNPHLWLKFL